MKVRKIQKPPKSKYKTITEAQARKAASDVTKYRQGYELCRRHVLSLASKLKDHSFIDYSGFVKELKELDFNYLNTDR